MSVTRILYAPAVTYSWQAGAACIGASADLFVGPEIEDGRARNHREARALLLCHGCPVRDACLTHALRIPERHGVWGGTTPGQRLVIRRAEAYAAGGDLPDEPE